MPDLKNLTITAGGTVTPTLQQFTVSVQVTNSQTGAVLADFTGANVLVWPNVLATLTVTQRRELIERVMWDVIRRRSGG